MITLLQFTLPIVIWKASVATDLTLQLNNDYSPKQFGFNLSMSGGSAFFQLLNVFVTPLTAIMRLSAFDCWEFFEAFFQCFSQTIDCGRRIAGEKRIGIQQHLTVSRIHHSNL